MGAFESSFPSIDTGNEVCLPFNETTRLQKRYEINSHNPNR